MAPPTSATDTDSPGRTVLALQRVRDYVTNTSRAATLSQAAAYEVLDAVVLTIAACLAVGIGGPALGYGWPTVTITLLGIGLVGATTVATTLTKASLRMAYAHSRTIREADTRWLSRRR